ncbi:MAG: hypothetical protein ACTSX9_05415 [Candidatus Njordarchaeales archaeon]
MRSTIENIFLAGRVTGSQYSEITEIEGRLAGLSAAKFLGVENIDEQLEELRTRYHQLLRKYDLLEKKSLIFKSL